MKNILKLKANQKLRSVHATVKPNWKKHSKSLVFETQDSTINKNGLICRSKTLVLMATHK